MKAIILILTFSFLTNSCLKSKIDNNSYFNSDLNWKMEIPKTWEQTPNSKLNENKEKAKKILSEEDPNFYEIDEDKFALVLTRDKFNSFNSLYFTRPNFKFSELTKEIQRDKVNKYKVANQYYKTDTTKTETIIIDNIPFLHYKMISDDLTLFAFAGLVKRYIFNISLKSNGIGENEILKNLYQSKFK